MLWTTIYGVIIDDAEELALIMPLYNPIEYNSNYSETTESLWFYSKDEATNFKAGITNPNNFTSFECKDKFLGNAYALPNPNPANGILKNSTIAVPLKYLNNFAISFEMPLINCKAELKLKWQKHCLLVPASAGNANANPINISFLPRTQTYVFLP